METIITEIKIVIDVPFPLTLHLWHFYIYLYIVTYNHLVFIPNELIEYIKWEKTLFYLDVINNWKHVLYDKKNHYNWETLQRGCMYSWLIGNNLTGPV